MMALSILSLRTHTQAKASKINLIVWNLPELCGHSPTGLANQPPGPSMQHYLSQLCIGYVRLD